MEWLGWGLTGVVTLAQRLERSEALSRQLSQGQCSMQRKSCCVGFDKSSLACPLDKEASVAGRHEDWMIREQRGRRCAHTVWGGEAVWGFLDY